MQEVWIEECLINSKVFSEETEAAEVSWLPKAKQELAVLFIFLASASVPVWCVLTTRSCTNTDNIPGPLRVFLVCVEPLLTNTQAAPLSWTWKSSISWGQALSYSIINYLIKNHRLKAVFSLWRGEKVTGGDAKR